MGLGEYMGWWYSHRNLKCIFRVDILDFMKLVYAVYIIQTIWYIKSCCESRPNQAIIHFWAQFVQCFHPTNQTHTIMYMIHFECWWTFQCSCCCGLHPLDPICFHPINQTKTYENKNTCLAQWKSPVQLVKLIHFQTGWIYLSKYTHLKFKLS